MAQERIRRRRTNLIDRALNNLIKLVTPRNLPQPNRSGPALAAADLIDRANIVTSQVLNKFSDDFVSFSASIASLHDSMTDLLDNLPDKERASAINSFQEILDLPIQTAAGFIAVTMQELRKGNDAVIAASKKRRTTRRIRIRGDE